MEVQTKRSLALPEHFLTQGANSLSDVELLAVFISRGSHNKSCLQLAFDLLQHFGDLRTLLNASLHSFKQVSGLGTRPYLQLQAAKEIWRRSDFIQLQKEIISNSQQTYSYLKKRLRDKKNETFAALFLDSQHRIIAYEELFSGTINMATVYPRPVIERVIQLNAASLILAHNHPSGLSIASEQDLAVTERMRLALELVDARLLDHIVIGDNEVYSIITQEQWRCQR
jgi:DNA repair protein RadC